MKKIAILGAGVGGLSLASLLDNSKYQIDIYEKKHNKDELGYNWDDDVDLNKLRELGFDFKLDNEDEMWHIYSCSGSKVSFVSDANEIAPINRKYLSNELYKRAEKKANIHFNSEVKIDENSIYVNDKNLDDYDLIIDCRGCINADLKNVFNAKRILIDKEEKRLKRNVFLKPCKINGVAWCNYTEEGIDILIGELGSLNNLTVKNTLNFIEDKMGVKCEDKDIPNESYIIPVRYPSTKFFDGKYVMLGDSVNMTVPIIGSGIVNSIEASYILANILNNSELTDDIDETNKLLWQYQYEYFKKRGIDSTQIDIFKNWLLSTKESNIDFLFQNRIISPDDLKNVMTGKFIDHDIISLLEKTKRLKSDILLTLGLASTLSKTLMAKNSINNMPTNYDEVSVEKWRKSFTKVLK